MQRRRKVKVLRLPWVAGEVVARSVDVAWPTMTVQAHDGVAFTRAPGRLDRVEDDRRRGEMDREPPVSAG